ncbi:hypothetical protein EV193_11249 [Herbihabitans rhizosphaerae]|uniref:ATP synthase protein I n=1 Tax=Herbihabitans rhizosphaerae TaxID=1872711 RepID=A0A4Q7KDW4_9PSEU|nr:hypothetical protein [Herbihabitans rhizosphaerae]RZS32415.1 hypothetical protein EV193_11249 [Herbihabitans rhizosphaerae]
MSDDDKALGLDTDIPATHEASVLKLAGAMRRLVLISTSVTWALALVLFGILYGGEGLLGSAVGGVIAIGSTLGTLWLMRMTAAQGPHLVMAAALGGFLGKAVVIFIAMTLLRDVEAIERYSLAFTMVAIVVVAAAADVRAFQRTKIPAVIPTSENS